MIGIITRKIEFLGIKRAVAFIVRRLFQMIWNSRNISFGIDLLDYNQNDVPINNNIKIEEIKSFGELTQKDCEDLKKYAGEKVIVAIQNNFKAGFRLFTAYMDGEIAGAQWVLIGGPKIFHIVPLADRDFFFMYAFIIDKFRQKGICKLLYARTLSILKGEGYRRGYGYTKEWNFQQKTFLHAGFKNIGKFIRVRIPGKTIIIWSSVIEPEFF